MNDKVRVEIKETSTISIAVREGADDARIHVLHANGDTLEFVLSGAVIRELAKQLPGPERAAQIERVK